MKSLKVLIVDDEPYSRNLLKVFVQDFCSEILLARKGSEAIDICRRVQDIDLILMDKIMPDTDGYEATRQIRLFNKDVKVIALSASPDESERELAIDSGSSSFLYKPVDIKVLTDLIVQFFNN
jgi:CheY-like chemotaxis protein